MTVLEEHIMSFNELFDGESKWAKSAKSWMDFSPSFLKVIVTPRTFSII